MVHPTQPLPSDSAEAGFDLFMYSSAWKWFIQDCGKKTLHRGVCYRGLAMCGARWLLAGCQCPWACPALQHPHLLQAPEDKEHRKKLLFSHRQSNPTLPAQAGGTVGNAQGGGLSLDFSSAALTGPQSLISQDLATAEDFDPWDLCHLEPYLNFLASAAESVQHHVSL